MLWFSTRTHFSLPDIHLWEIILLLCNTQIINIHSILISMKKVFILSLLMGTITAIFSFGAFAQQPDVNPSNKKEQYREVVNDPYLPNEFDNKKTSPAFKVRDGFFFATQVNINEDGENIIGDAANEPSIAIDPTNPNRMVIGWRQFDNITSDFRQAGVGYTEDGGETWTFPASIDAGVFRSDPVLDADSEGNFYYNSLTVGYSSDYTCDVYKIASEGFEWDEGTDAQGGDKQWMVVDKTGGTGDGNIYSFWTSYWSICYPGFFTRSTDGNNSYEACVDVPGDPNWGTMAVGPEGEVYIVGEGYGSEIIVAKSTTAQEPGQPVDFDFYSEVDLDGELSIYPSVNPAGLMGQADIDVDVSGGPGHGNVYVLASVYRYSGGDPGDVMFARSTDGGQTWEEPVRINDDELTMDHQWFGTMSVAPNGRIDVAWLDTRNSPGNSVLSQLYYAYSLDQGENWSANFELSELFDPHIGWPQQQKMGDYFDMRSDDESAHLAWCGTFNQEQDVYYGRISPLVTAMEDFTQTGNPLSLSCIPNPVNDKAVIRYTVPQKSFVRLAVYDVYGNQVKLLHQDQVSVTQNHFDFDVTGISRGVYFCRLEAGKWSKTIKVAVCRGL
jgi:hypothetical protein